MTNEEQYVQCRLQRNDTYQIVYIPKKFAVIDDVIKIKEDGVWSSGWIVTHTYSEKNLADLTNQRTAQQIFSKKLK